MDAETVCQSYYRYSETVNIFYEEYGTGDVPVLFLHGFGASHKTWDDIRDLFPMNRYRCLFIDLKGFGFSSKPNDNAYSITEQANIIIGFTQFLNLEAFFLVGHSYGGGVALLINVLLTKSESKARIEKMILIDCAAYNDEIPFFIKVLTNKVLNFLSQRVLNKLFVTKISLNRLFYDDSKVTAKIIERYAYFLGTPAIAKSMTRSAKQIIPNNYYELIEEYKRIETKILIIWGYNDPVIPRKVGEKLNANLKNSRLMVINKCGHIPQEECPNETYMMMEDFFSNP